MRGDVVELLPAEGTDAAIVVGLDLESGGRERECREFRNRSGGQERHHYAIASNVQTGEACRSGEKNVRIGSQIGLAQDNFALGEIGDLQRGYKVSFVEIG